MTEVILCIPLLLALLAVMFGVIRAISGAYLNYRVRLRLLERLEKNPELVNSPDEVQDLYERLAPDPQLGSQDYTVTGVFLALLGASCIAWGWYLHIGPMAAGIYWGGMICVILGLFLGILGIFVRILHRA